jgi:hypothetical protein
MTQICPRPILAIRMLTRLARRTVNGLDAERKQGIRRKHSRNFSPENRAKYEAVVAERERLQIPFESRLDVFRNSPHLHKTQRHVSVARSKTEIADRNRALLSKVVASKAAKAAANARKKAIDATYPQRETHETNRTERWKDRVKVRSHHLPKS